jgi:hypothetical protein
VSLNQPLPCLVCGMQPNAVGGHGMQPYDALMFDAGSGHYGSGVWDTMSGARSLSINVCDDCLVAHKDRVAVVTKVEPVARVVFEFTPWEPDAGAGKG